MANSSTKKSASKTKKSDIIKSVLSQRVASLRSSLKLTQSAVSEVTGLDRGHYIDIERGRSLPTVATLAVLCDVFKCSADYLLGKSDIANTAALDNTDAYKIALMYTSLNEKGKGSVKSILETLNSAA
jgi:transcriptional regulator with XRE-family HTH domain